MATHVSSFPHTTPIVHTHPLAHGIPLPHLRLPRLRTLLTVAFILGGLGMPALMFFGILPVNFLLGFIAFALTAVGGVMALIFIGEI